MEGERGSRERGRDGRREGGREGERERCSVTVSLLFLFIIAYPGFCFFFSSSVDPAAAHFVTTARNSQNVLQQTLYGLQDVKFQIRVAY